MSEQIVIWALFAPLFAGLLGVLWLLAWPGDKGERPLLQGWRYDAALVAACGGPVAQAALLVVSEGRAALETLERLETLETHSHASLLGVGLLASPLSTVGVVVADAALFCALLISWPARADAEARWRAGDMPARVLGIALTSFLLAGALLATDRIAQILCLLAAALPVAALAALPLPLPTTSTVEGGDAEARERQWRVARQLAGGVKQVSLASLGTLLLVAGALMMARYPFNMEQTGTLQAGVGILCVGLAVRAGVMPFTGGASDLIEAAPQAAIVMLGAVTPAVLLVGLEMLGPSAVVSGQWSVVSGQSQSLTTALLLPGVGALLAGLRSLAVVSGQWSVVGAVREPPLPRQTLATDHWPLITALVGASVALQVAWALFGVVSGSHQGTVGAALLAANLALTVPLMLSGPPRLLMMAGAASLVGLPPFGGFPGALLVAQAATNAGGVWLALLLLGSVLVAAAWVNYQVASPGSRVPSQAQAAPDVAQAVPEPPVRDLRFLWWALLAAQLALVALSLPLYQWLGVRG